MKKSIVLFLFIFICNIFYSQYQTDNIKKYWYYKWRFLNDFVQVGDCRGCSMPMNERRYNNTPDFKYGDGFINQFYYIATLAMEYKILRDNSQPRNKTVRELFYALEAINRLDYYAETYFVDANGISGSPSLNGFFIRDDVPLDFVCDFLNNPSTCQNGQNNRYEKFNNGLIKYPPLTKIDNTSPSVFNNETYKIRVEGNCGPYLYTNPKILSGEIVNNVFCPAEPTLDQITPILLGLAFVVKYVDANIAHYENGIPQTFLDGKTFLVSEAKEIIDRIIKYGKGNGFWGLENPVANQCIIGKCDKKQPSNCALNIECGGALGFLSYALAEGACHAYNGTSPPNISTILNVISCSKYHNFTSILSKPIWDCLGATPSASWVSSTALTGCLGTSLSGEAEKIMFAAALSSAWYSRFPILPFLKYNDTGFNLSIISSLKSFQHFPLIHQALHGGANTFLSPQYYEYLINSAPCTGPYNFDFNYYPHIEWSTSNRWQHPDRRGATTNNNRGIFPGYYNGMDYMFLHNLYYTVVGNQPNVTLPFYQDYIDRTIGLNFPSSGSFPIGSSSNPITIGAFNTLTYTGTLASNSAVTFRGGVEVTLKPGCEMLAGTESRCYVEPFNCSSVNMDHGFLRTDSTGLGAEGNTYGEMGLLSTKNNITKIGYKNTNTEIFTLEKEEENVEVIKFENQLHVYPNPSNYNFTMVFSLSKVSTVEINLTDLNGRIIKQLTNQKYAEGFHELRSDASELTNGIYLIQFKSSELNKVIKLVVNK